MTKKTDPLALSLDQETPELVALRRENFALERKLLEKKSVEARLQDFVENNAQMQREIDVLSGFTKRSGPPTWMTKKPTKTKHHGTPWLMLSDLHLDEVVNAAEMNYMNCYNREIALQRLDRVTKGFIQVTQDHWAGIKYDGAVVCLGGDIFSGDIHEELKETNEDAMLGSVDFWIDPLAAALDEIADTFGKIHVPVVAGNHGRTSRKAVMKKRSRSNFDWFIGAQLSRLFKGDKRITFDVSESADLLIPSYNQNVMLTHGDQASGGAGIGGVWPPIMRLDARKRQRQANVNQPYDLMVLGHWHTLTFGPSFIVNGALKGYDEYAFISNFGYEVPTQAAWLMTPEHGKTWTAPIFCQDREAEGW